MPLDEQFCQCVVNHAACVLAGIKPAGLFNYIPGRPSACQACACERLCDAQVRRQAGMQALGFTRLFARQGLRCDVLCVGRGRALMLVSRTDELAHLIGRPDVAGFLAQAGYDVAGPRQLVRSLRLKMAGFERTRCPGGEQGMGGPRACEADACAFPHEVGVVLGYPLSDVVAFIARHGQGALASGVWKAYGDPEGARACWRAMRECRARALERYAHGAPLEQLVA